MAFGSYMIGSLCSVYILVGSKLLYIRKHPDQDNDTNNINNLNIADFVPSNIEELKKGKSPKSSKEGHRSNKHGSKVRLFSQTATNTTTTYTSDIDSITDNPNNYFFNQTLEKMSHNDGQSSSATDFYQYSRF